MLKDRRVWSQSGASDPIRPDRRLTPIVHLLTEWRLLLTAVPNCSPRPVDESLSNSGILPDSPPVVEHPLASETVDSAHSGFRLASPPRLSADGRYSAVGERRQHDETSPTVNSDGLCVYQLLADRRSSDARTEASTSAGQNHTDCCKSFPLRPPAFGWSDR